MKTIIKAWRWVVPGVVFVGMIASGCETAKGAVDGFKRDWDALRRVDQKMQDNAW